MGRIVPGLIVLVVLWCHAGHAALYDRGGGLIYDSDLNVTWLQDANYARTSGYHPTGKMNWYEAKAWADGLVYAGFDDWRLPRYYTWQYPYDERGGELPFLYYRTLGNWNYGGSNLGPFINVERGGNDGSGGAPFTYMDGRYWSDTLTWSNGGYWVGFHFLWTDANNTYPNRVIGEGSSGMTAANDTAALLAWLVRDGDVGLQTDNRPPVFGPCAPVQAEEYRAIEFRVAATDPNGDNVFLSVAASPDGSVFDPSSGIFRWTPVSGQAGDYVVTFIARDDGVPVLSSALDVAISVGVTSPTGLVDIISDTVLAAGLATYVENSYLANLKSVNAFLGIGNVRPAINQLEAFIHKVEQDIAQGAIAPETGSLYIQMANDVLSKL